MKDVHAHSAVSGSLQSHRLYPARLLCPWDPPGKNTGVGCHALLQGIFPSQISNSCISCIGRKRLYHWTKAAQTAGQLMRSLSRLVFVLLLPFMSLYFPVPPEYHLSLHILLSSARPLGYISLSCTEDIQPEHGSSFCNPCHSHFWCFSSLNSFTVEIETIYSGNLDSILMTSSVNC